MCIVITVARKGCQCYIRAGMSCFKGAHIHPLTQTVTEEPSTPGVSTFVRSLDDARFQLIEKKGNKEIYRDRETGTKWVVKVERKGD